VCVDNLLVMCGRLQVVEPADASMMPDTRTALFTVLATHPTIKAAHQFRVVWSTRQLVQAAAWAAYCSLMSWIRWIRTPVDVSQSVLVDDDDILSIFQETVDFESADATIHRSQLVHSLEGCLQFKDTSGATPLTFEQIEREASVIFRRCAHRGTAHQLSAVVSEATEYALVQQ
jgi:hypothetical protein